MSFRSLFLFPCLFLCCLRASHASTTAIFDFEDAEPAPMGTNVSLFSSPTTLANSGVSMTISHETSVPFAFSEQTGTLFEARFGTRSLTMFNGINGAADPGALILDFDSALTSAMVDMGDFGQDADNLLLQAFSGPSASGTLVDSESQVLPGGGNLFVFDTLSVSGSGIRSLRIIGGADAFPNSVFFDNIVVTAVPEPNAALAACLGFGFLGCTRRKR
ncbi:MAG: hypothetical protein AAF664_06390 [Planctomycetota bacterium]